MPKTKPIAERLEICKAAKSCIGCTILTEEDCVCFDCATRSCGDCDIETLSQFTVQEGVL